MSFNLRKRTPLSYYEPDEPKFDEYLYCEECSDFVYDYCAIHGPLLVVPDDKVPVKTGFPSYVPRAALTIPNVFLHLAPSIIPGAGLGVFSTLTLPRGVRFGPYRGQRTQNVDSMYCWQIYNDHNKRSHVIDAADSNSSNWMRYVNCARHWKEQNLLAYQYKGQLYYRTIKIIPRFTELMVFYGSEFANALHINLAKYNNAKYLYTLEVMRTAKPLQIKKAPTISQEFLTEEHFHIIDEETKQMDSNQTLPTPPSNYPVTPQTVELENLGASETNVLDLKPTEIDKSESRLKTTELENLGASEINVLGPTPMEIDKSDNPLQQISIENFQIFKFNDENLSKSTNNTEITVENNLYDEKTGKKLQKCEFCQMIMTKRHYSTHKQKHLNPERFSCTFCPYKTFRRYRLNHHLSQHTKIYKYSCEKCSFRTNYGRNFRLHCARHDNSVVINPPIRKERTCELCGFKTRTPSVMQTHKVKHTGVKYACDQCSFSSFHRKSIKRHCLAVHSSK